MSRDTKKETIIVILAFAIGIIGSEVAFYFGSNALGKFILLTSISLVIIFVTIGNIKFWFGKKSQNGPVQGKDKNDK